jgi:hypothetical protein
MTAAGPRLGVALGLFRRMIIFLAAMSGTLLFGPGYLAGAAVGYLGAFSLVVVREVRSHAG